MSSTAQVLRITALRATNLACPVGRCNAFVVIKIGAKRCTTELCTAHDACPEWRQLDVAAVLWDGISGLPSVEITVLNRDDPDRAEAAFLGFGRKLLHPSLAGREVRAPLMTRNDGDAKLLSSYGTLGNVFFSFALCPADTVPPAMLDRQSTDLLSEPSMHAHPPPEPPQEVRPAEVEEAPVRAAPERRQTELPPPEESAAAALLSEDVTVQDGPSTDRPTEGSPEERDHLAASANAVPRPDAPTPPHSPLNVATTPAPPPRQPTPPAPPAPEPAAGENADRPLPALAETPEPSTPVVAVLPERKTSVTEPAERRLSRRPSSHPAPTDAAAAAIAAARRRDSDRGTPLQAAATATVAPPAVPREPSQDSYIPPVSLSFDAQCATNLLGRDMGNPGDPYVVLHGVTAEGDVVELAQTAICWSTNDPVWNKRFSFPELDQRILRLEVLLFDYDEVGDNDFLGWAELPIALDVNSARKSASVVLLPRDDLNQGEDEAVLGDMHRGNFGEFFFGYVVEVHGTPRPHRRPRVPPIRHPNASIDSAPFVDLPPASLMSGSPRSTPRDPPGPVVRDPSIVRPSVRRSVMTPSHAVMSPKHGSPRRRGIGSRRGTRQSRVESVRSSVGHALSQNSMLGGSTAAPKSKVKVTVLSATGLPNDTPVFVRLRFGAEESRHAQHTDSSETPVRSTAGVCVMAFQTEFVLQGPDDVLNAELVDAATGAAVAVGDVPVTVADLTRPRTVSVTLGKAHGLVAAVPADVELTVVLAAESLPHNVPAKIDADSTLHLCLKGCHALPPRLAAVSLFAIITVVEGDQEREYRTPTVVSCAEGLVRWFFQPPPIDLPQLPDVTVALYHEDPHGFDEFLGSATLPFAALSSVGDVALPLAPRDAEAGAAETTAMVTPRGGRRVPPPSAPSLGLARLSYTVVPQVSRGRKEPVAPTVVEVAVTKASDLTPFVSASQHVVARLACSDNPSGQSELLTAPISRTDAEEVGWTEEVLRFSCNGIPDTLRVSLWDGPERGAAFLGEYEARLKLPQAHVVGNAVTTELRPRQDPHFYADDVMLMNRCPSGLGTITFVVRAFSLREYEQRTRELLAAKGSGYVLHLQVTEVTDAPGKAVYFIRVEAGGQERRTHLELSATPKFRRNLRFTLQYDTEMLQCYLMRRTGADRDGNGGRDETVAEVGIPVNSPARGGTETHTSWVTMRSDGSMPPKLQLRWRAALLSDPGSHDASLSNAVQALAAATDSRPATAAAIQATPPHHDTHAADPTLSQPSPAPLGDTSLRGEIALMRQELSRLSDAQQKLPQPLGTNDSFVHQTQATPPHGAPVGSVSTTHPPQGLSDVTTPVPRSPPPAERVEVCVFSAAHSQVAVFKGSAASLVRDVLYFACARFGIPQPRWAEASLMTKTAVLPREATLGGLFTPGETVFLVEPEDAASPEHHAPAAAKPTQWQEQRHEQRHEQRQEQRPPPQQAPQPPSQRYDQRYDPQPRGDPRYDRGEFLAQPASGDQPYHAPPAPAASTAAPTADPSFAAPPPVSNPATMPGGSGAAAARSSITQQAQAYQAQAHEPAQQSYGGFHAPSPRPRDPTASLFQATPPQEPLAPYTAPPLRTTGAAHAAPRPAPGPLPSEKARDPSLVFGAPTQVTDHSARPRPIARSPSHAIAAAQHQGGYGASGTPNPTPRAEARAVVATRLRDLATQGGPDGAGSVASLFVLLYGANAHSHSTKAAVEYLSQLGLSGFARPLVDGGATEIFAQGPPSLLALAVDGVTDRQRVWSMAQPDLRVEVEQAQGYIPVLQTGIRVARTWDEGRTLFQACAAQSPDGAGAWFYRAADYPHGTPFVRFVDERA